MKLMRPPHKWLLLTSTVFLICNFFVWDKTIDLHLHDTYYVMPLAFLYLAFTALLLLLWLLYIITSKWLFSPSLSRLHVLLSIIPVMLLGIFCSVNETSLVGYPRRYFKGSDDSWNAFETFRMVNRAVTAIIIVFAVGQLVYLANIILGLKSRSI